MSYSRPHGILPKTRQLITHTAAVKYEILESELQALLVEAELIHTYQPHYNSLLKDDKSPLYIITTKETYPRVIALRKSDLSKYPVRRQFGPFPSAAQVREVLKLARRLYPYCAAGPSHRACFYVHLGLCPGACVAAVTPQTYSDSITQLERFLQGKHRQIVTDLTQQIRAAAGLLDFETAEILKRKLVAFTSVVGRYRMGSFDQPLPNLTEDTSTQQLAELKRLLSAHGVRVERLRRIEGYDVANLQGQSAAVSMVVIHDGKLDHDLYRHFSVKSLKTPNDVGMLREVIRRRQGHPEWGRPALIIVDGGKPQIKAVRQALAWQVPVIGLAKHPDRLLIPHPQTGTVAAYRLDSSRPADRLVIALRDEAHRFARRLHHHRLDKQFFEPE